MSEKHLTRIAALLRQAERTDNEHEADAYMAAAQRLATLTSIDLEVARQHSTSTEKRARPVQTSIRIGEPGRRGLRTYVELFLAIARANDVTCDIASNSTYVNAYGFDSDIEVCQSLYASLIVQMVRASDGYLKSGDYRSETRLVRVRHRDAQGVEHTGRELRPIHGTTARLSFQRAFAERIGTRLAEARVQATRDAGNEVATTPDETGTEITSGRALVLIAKQLEVTDFYRQRSRARGSWRGVRTSGHSSQAARAGDRAARSARLGSNAAVGGARIAIGASA
jgi:Protein of unknown function (DUF2786)